MPTQRSNPLSYPVARNVVCVSRTSTFIAGTHLYPGSAI